MSIASYSELKTAIASWLNRDDLTAKIPDFIALGEAHLNRKLRIRAMETRVTLDTVGGDEYYALPVNFKAMRRFRLETQPRTDLEFLTPENMDALYAGSQTKKPLAYTVEGDEVRLGPIPDGVYTMNMLYHKKIDALSDSNTTNFFILNAPDLMLWASLVSAAPFLKDDERIATWLGLRDQCLNDMVVEDELDRYGGGAMSGRSEYQGV